MGSGRFASYKDYGESIWRIGYGSMEIHGKVVTHRTRATEKEVDEQLNMDLQMLSHKLSKIIFWPLNPKRKQLSLVMHLVMDLFHLKILSC